MYLVQYVENSVFFQNDTQMLYVIHALIRKILSILTAALLNLPTSPHLVDLSVYIAKTGLL